MAGGDQPTVAVLGTGIMGRPMAENLLAAHFGVRAWNRSEAKARSLAERGAEVCTDVRDAVRGADLVLTMLSDGPAVEQTMSRALDAVDPGAVWIQSSTVGVEWAGRLGELAQRAGLDIVDAPVLGTREPAEQGTLVVLAAGPRRLETRCAPAFGAVGSRTLWVGEYGAASRLKLVANAWVLALTNATAESIALARALGVDPKLFLEAIKGGSVDVPYAHIKGAAMMEGRFPPSFPLHLAVKDAALVLQAGDGVDLAGTRAVLAHLEAAERSGHGGADMAALIHGLAP